MTIGEFRPGVFLFLCGFSWRIGPLKKHHWLSWFLVIESLSILAVKSNMANELLHPASRGCWPRVWDILEFRMQNCWRNMWLTGDQESGSRRRGYLVLLWTSAAFHEPRSEASLAWKLSKKRDQYFAFKNPGFGRQMRLKSTDPETLVCHMVVSPDFCSFHFYRFLRVNLISDYDLTSPLNA